MSTRENIRLIARAPFACSNLRYNAFQTANKKGADHSARMRRLVCTFVVCKPAEKRFLTSRPIVLPFTFYLT